MTTTGIPTLNLAQIQTIVKQIIAGDFIPAIKNTRQFAECGLLEAKVFCDGIRDSIPASTINYKLECDSLRERNERLNATVDQQSDDINRTVDKIDALNMELDTLKRHKNTLLDMLKADIS